MGKRDALLEIDMKSIFWRIAFIVTIFSNTLAGCVAEPSSTVMSRLPDSHPSAANPLRPLTPEELKYYEETDKRVLRFQDDEDAARTRSRYSPAPYYSPPPGYYNNGGWSPSSGYGYPRW